MRNEGFGVGRKYKTYGELWDVEPEILQTGLLHLILDQLEKTPINKDLEIETHSKWLQREYPRVSALICKHQKECQRIEKFCRLELLGRDVKDVDPNRFSLTYRQSWSDHWKLLTKLMAKVDRLKKVKSLEDLAELAGIGMTAAKKIKTKMEKSK